MNLKFTGHLITVYCHYLLVSSSIWGEKNVSFLLTFIVLYSSYGVSGHLLRKITKTRTKMHQNSCQAISPVTENNLQALLL